MDFPKDELRKRPRPGADSVDETLSGSKTTFPSNGPSKDADDDDNDEEYDDDDDEDEENSVESLVEVGRKTSGNIKVKESLLTKSDIDKAYHESLKSLSLYRETLRPFLSSKAAALLDTVASTLPELKSGQPIIDEEKEVLCLRQPQSLDPSVRLREYQVFGFSWLVHQYKRGMNCILADEMGLGKTLQTISFIAQLLHSEKERGSYLIVVPLSVMFNWIQEFKKFCPSTKVIRLHANDKNEQARMRDIINDHSRTEVVVTTYDTVKAGGLKKAIRKIRWNAVILDEGHRIKNDDSLITRSVLQLKTRFKLILTGTPVQNNLHESYVLLSYLHPDVFTDSKAFDDAFNLNAQSERVNAQGKLVQGERGIRVDRSTLAQVHYMMRPFILRRLKMEVEQKLPPKLETKISCPMSKMQKYWIQNLLLKERNSITKLEGEAVAATSDEGEFKKLQAIIVQLRKAANHPFLFPDVETVREDGQPTEEIIEASGKMVVLDLLLKKLFERGHRVVIFSQYTRLLDILSDYMDWRGYKFNRLDGSTNRVMREVMINQFNKANSDIFAFLLSTRAGGEGVNLFTADTVILYDSDWNPQVDLQAMARVHRIGQTKVVHVYRLVTIGSVEERIVQRAQKKLFLDGMVNRGSTAQSRALDETVPDDENDEIEGSTTTDPKNVLSALKFGWNSVFSAKESEDSENGELLSDETIELIVDRTRGLPGGEGGEEKAAKLASLFEKKEVSLADFDESEPFISLRKWEGTDLSSAGVANSGSLKDIASTWRSANGSAADETRGRGKRERVSRMYEMEVEGVGTVSILKKNDYALEDGEPSVHSHELANSSSARQSKARKSVPSYLSSRGRQIAGRDFSNQEHCQLCWEGGDLLLCDSCPASFHPECVGLTEPPKSKQWFCPHHNCCKCWRKSGECGLLFRCEVCPDAYCEDCMPYDSHILGNSERFSKLGYRNPNSCCFSLCNARCQYFSEHGMHPPESEEVVQVDDEINKRVKTFRINKPTGHAKELLLGISDPGEDEGRMEIDALHSAASAKGSRLVAASGAGMPLTYVQGGENSMPPKRQALSLVQKSAAVEALDSCKLPDIKLRLDRAHSSKDSKARLPFLSALPHFANNWESSSSSCRKILKEIVDKLKESFDEMGLDSMKTDTDNDTDSDVFNFSGVPGEATPDQLAQAFIDVVRLLSNIHKNHLIEITRLLGIVQFTPFKNVDRKRDARTMTEPRFRHITEMNLGSRSKTEECIASFVCTLLPQNMIMSVSGLNLRKKPIEVENADGSLSLEFHSEDEKVDNIEETVFNTARLIETWLHFSADPPNQYFMALSALNYYGIRCSGWSRNVGAIDEAEFNRVFGLIRSVCQAYKADGVEFSLLPHELLQLLNAKKTTLEEILVLYDIKVVDQKNSTENDEYEFESAVGTVGRGRKKRHDHQSIDGFGPNGDEEQELNNKCARAGLKFIRPSGYPTYDVIGPFMLFCETVRELVERDDANQSSEDRKQLYVSAWSMLDNPARQQFVGHYKQVLQTNEKAKMRYLITGEVNTIPDELSDLERRAFTFFREFYLAKLRSALLAKQQQGAYDSVTVEKVMKSLWNSQPLDRRERFMNQARESQMVAIRDCDLVALTLQKDFYHISHRRPLQLKASAGTAPSPSASATVSALPLPSASSDSATDEAHDGFLRLVVPTYVMSYQGWHLQLNQDVAAREAMRKRVLLRIIRITSQLPMQCWKQEDGRFPTNLNKALRAIELFLYFRAQSPEEYQSEETIKNCVRNMLVESKPPPME